MQRLSAFFACSMQRRLRAYLLLFMLIPLVGAGLIFYQFSVSRVFQLSLKASRQVIDKTAASIDDLLSETIRLPALINADPDLQRIMGTDFVSRESFLNGIREGDGKLQSLQQFRSDIFGIYVLMDNGMRLKSRYFEWDASDFLQSELYKRAHTNYYRIWTQSPDRSLAVRNNGQSVVALCTQLRSAVDDRPRGVTVIELQRYWLERALRMEQGTGALLLLNEQNELIASGAGDLNEEQVRACLSVTEKAAIGRAPAVIELPESVFICQRMEQSNWIVVGVIPKTYLNQSGRTIALVILLVAGIFFTVSLFVSRQATRYELRPIVQLARGIRRLETGNFDIALAVERGDEIGRLTEAFNNMAAQLHTLILQNEEKQRRLHRAEFRALQAQINPHFLYNTLDSISGLAHMGRTDDVSRLVDALTVFFKTSLSGGRDIIPLSEELRHTTSYLAIQKIRYADIFTYQLHMQPSAAACAVPKLILQPLVENALYHGIKPCAHPCLLQINVLDHGAELTIEIIDNGVGMPAERLAALRRQLQFELPAASDSFGVHNVDERIKAMMGPHYGLHFESEPGVGTAVIVRIRKMQGGRQNV